MMADQCTMAELLRAPTEGLEKDNPHDHICWFNKITSTIKYKDVPNSAIKLMLFPFSLVGAARRWLEKEPPRSIHTWVDLVSKFINEFFPPSRTTNLHNEISNFQQRFDESFHEAWDRYKDLLRACPHYGFTELHQLDTFYNVINPTDQDFLNAAAGGNLLERHSQDVLTIIENKSKCLAASGNTFLELRDNIQGYVSASAVNYNQGNPGYRPPGMANQIRPPGFAQPNVKNNQNRFGPPQGFNHGNNFNPEHSYQAPAQQNQNVHLNELEKVRRINEANMKAMQTQIDMVKNELRNEMKNSIQTSLSNQTNEIKNMMASLLQMNTTSTSGLGSLPSNTVANPKGKLKSITTRSEGSNVLPEKLLDLDSTKDLHPPLHDHPDFSRVDALPSTNNEDKIFNPCILIQDKSFEIIPHVVQDKKLASSNASLMLEDFDPPFYEPLFFKEVPSSKMLLPFSSKNEEKVFKPGIHTSEKFHSFLSQNYLIKAINFSKSIRFSKSR
nr:reverse transcriptase domain-containing protein [Tanacetum cinerariifolium]